MPQSRMESNGSSSAVSDCRVNPWTESEAVVFVSIAELRTRFGEFASLLGRESVVSGSLVEALRIADAPQPRFVGSTRNVRGSR